MNWPKLTTSDRKRTVLVAVRDANGAAEGRGRSPATAAPSCAAEGRSVLSPLACHPPPPPCTTPGNEDDDHEDEGGHPTPAVRLRRHRGSGRDQAQGEPPDRRRAVTAPLDVQIDLQHWASLLHLFETYGLEERAGPAAFCVTGGVAGPVSFYSNRAQTNGRCC